MRSLNNKIKILNEKKIKYFLFYLAFIYFLYLTDATPTVFLIFSGITASILFSWLIYREFKDNQIKITPIMALLIFPFFMLGLSSIYHGFYYQNQSYTVFSSYYVYTKSIVMGYLMFATGLFFQYLGIQFLRPDTFATARLKEKKKDIKIFSLFILLFILSKYTEQNFKLGMLQNFINLIPLAMILFMAIKDRGDVLTSYNYKRNVVIIGSVIIFVSNLFLLTKTNLIFSISPILIFYSIRSQKLLKYKVVLIFFLTVLTYLFFIQPLVSNARALLMRQNQVATTEFLTNYIISGEYSIPVEIYSKTNNPLEMFLQRMFEINSPAYIYEQTKSRGFQNGKTFENIAISLVPRLLWPDKPSFYQGQKYALDNFGLEKVNIGMLIVGELYWNFGFMGIIFGSLILGFLLGLLWKLINPYALKNFVYFTLYFYLLQSCIGGSEFSSVFVGIIQLIIIYYLIRFAETVLKPRV